MNVCTTKFVVYHAYIFNKTQGYYLFVFILSHTSSNYDFSSIKLTIWAWMSGGGAWAFKFKKEIQRYPRSHYNIGSEIPKETNVNPLIWEIVRERII